MQTRDIIVIGGSAGALRPLRKILRALPVRLPAAIFVVIHTSPESTGVLPDLLTRHSGLRAENAKDGLPISRGRVYVAPPDHHLLIKNGCMRVTRGPRENRFRPAVDPLFRTAATVYGPRVVGVILSGGQDDGVLGLTHIKNQGGVVVVQDPAEADSTGMPESAIREVAVDHVLPADDIAAILAGLVGPGVEEEMGSGDDRTPRDPAEEGTDALDSGILPGLPSGFTCPECGGALWEVHEGKLVRFQCHVGHAFNGESLVAAQTDGLEAALWTAVRALEESSALRRRMAERRGMLKIAESYERDAGESEARAKVVRGVLVTDPSDTIHDPQPENQRS